MVSLCTIVKNEERILSRCLDSVRELVSEMILVDTGSTDATPRIAAEFGATVIPFDFTAPDFAAARNHGLARAKGGWILVLDADEILEPASAALVRELIARNENAGYYFQRLNRLLKAGATPDYLVRLFPNRPEYRYRGRVHETIDASILQCGGRLVRTGVRIHHEFAADPQARRQRNLWYIGILKEEISAHPEDNSRLDFLAAEYHQLGMFDKAAEIAEQIVAARPLDPQAHLHAGVYHLLYKPDRERARADFMAALALRPGYQEARAFLELMEEQERLLASPALAQAPGPYMTQADCR
ncbi:MAG TPA: glycosyltransferase [Bryobacteraceae bacterium]|nr:glycosyltransferase [Bryobacteraceae bacterium]